MRCMRLLSAQHTPHCISNAPFHSLSYRGVCLCACCLQVRASYLQLYREVIHDLLGSNAADTKDAKGGLNIRRDPDRGIYVQGLSERVLTSAAGLSKLIEEGNKKRAVAATLMNAESSRSHAVVSVWRDCTAQAKPSNTATQHSSHPPLHTVPVPVRAGNPIRRAPRPRDR